jgi:pyruvate/2-oxoglutarate dehydrogenase complex dihydrolipoamide acyltransferase (E2) component
MALPILKKSGDSINHSEALFEVEAGKATSSIVPEVTGSIEEIYVKEGDTVNCNNVLAIIKGEKNTKEVENSKSGFKKR